MEPEICTKMLKMLSEKLRAKFPATTRGYSMVKIARLNDALICKQAQQEANHCSKKKRKGQKGKVKKNSKIEKPKDVGHFLIQKLQIWISAHARVTIY